MNDSRSVIRWAASAVLVAMLVPGCGGSTSGPVPFEDFSTRLAKLVCDRLVDCCRAQAMPLDPVTCNEGASAYFRGEFSKPDPAKVRYDGNVAEGCLSAYRDALTGCSFNDSEALLAACDPLFVGLVPLGGSCRKSEECAPQAGGHVSCHFASSGDDGMCALDTSPGAAPHGKLGEACAGSCTSNTCERSAPTVSGVTAICFASDGLYCDLQYTCQPTLADGAACRYTGCNPTSYCAAGICAAKKPDGATCSGADECVAEHCQYPNGSTTTTGSCGKASIATPMTCAGVFDD